MASSKRAASKGNPLLRTAALIAMLLLFGTTAAFPQADSTPAKDNLFRFFVRESFTPENRIELTRRIDAYCRDVLDKVPTNTPAEEAWVMSESKTE
jgi:hypothetical protein